MLPHRCILNYEEGETRPRKSEIIEIRKFWNMNEENEQNLNFEKLGASDEKKRED